MTLIDRCRETAEILIMPTVDQRKGATNVRRTQKRTIPLPLCSVGAV